MTRLATIDPATATGKTKTLLDQVQAGLGMIPNMTKIMANSPALLQAYLGIQSALGSGKLNRKLRQQLAVEVGEVNECQYCVSAHTAVGKLVGLSDHELLAARRGTASDPKTAAALEFASAILDSYGNVSDTELAAIRRAGYTDEEIAEILGHVVLNIFTNYFNRLAHTEIDFPVVELGAQRIAA